jgi:predicted MFS family arabinose efflux permease
VNRRKASIETPLPLASRQSPRAGAAVRAVVMVAMLTLYFCAVFQRMAVPATIFEELQRDFRLSASAVTGLGAAFLYVYASMQLVAGLAADRYGGRRMLLAGGTMMFVGTAMMPLSSSVEALYATRILIGLGSSFVFLSIVKELDTLFARRHFAALMGVTVVVNSLAAITATVPFERAVHAWNWRFALGGAAAMSAAALATSWWTLRRLDRTPSQHTGLPLHLLGDVFRNRRSWPLLAANLVNFPVPMCLQIILGKKFLQDTAGLSSVSAAGFVLVLATTSAAAALGGGVILRLTRQRRKPILVGAPALILLATLLMLGGVLWTAPAWLYLVAYVLMGLTAFYYPTAMASMKELNRPDAVAVSISVINATGYAGIAILSNVSGAVLDLFRNSAREVPGRIIYPSQAYAVLLAGFAALLVVGVVLAALWVPETHGRALTLEEIEKTRKRGTGNREPFL